MQKLLLILLCFPMIGFGQGWERTFGGNDIEFGYSVQQTIDGGYIVGGQTTSFGNGNYDVYLIKTDGNGDSLWTKTYGEGGNEGGFVQQTNDGGYIIGGWKSYLSAPNYSYVYLIKTDGNGIEQWSQTYGGDAIGYSVQQTTDGGYIITGWTGSFPNYDVYLIKTDGSGIEQWSKTFGGIDNDRAYSVQQTIDGGYIITGYTESFGNGYYDVYLIKTDGSGIEQWSKTFGGMFSNDIGYSVQQTTDGGYIITGETTSFITGNTDVYLIKTNGSGVEQWSQTFGDGITYGRGYSVQQTIDGGYIITGDTGYPYNASDVYLIKTDANGNATSTFNIPINPNRKLEKVVDILGRDIKPQTNIPFIEIYDDGTVEKRITID